MNQSTKHGPGFDRPMRKDEINACPIGCWQGPVRLVRTRAELTRALDDLRGETLLGFDTETRPAYRKGEHYPPSLLQLAAEKEVFLFQLNRLGLPASLCQLLADPAVIKAGVALAYDLRELRDITSFVPAGFIDLAGMAAKAGVQNRGLRGLAAVLLGFRISKSAQTSNWARKNLTGKQIRYSATDAWVGRQLYLALQKLESGSSALTGGAVPGWSAGRAADHPASNVSGTCP